MKVTEHLKNAKKPLISFEILPPLKGKSIQSIYDSIDPLMEFKPSFINVTYHREEFVYKKREKGFLEKIAIKKRPGTVGICAAIMNKYQVDAIPHIICGGFTKEETENALIDLNFLGVDNVLALRGDPIKTESTFVQEEGGHAYAVDLVKQIVGLNKGIYFDEDLQNANPTNFCIGVAGYPEKHFESPNQKTDLKHLKAKVDAGAEYIITQLFYDNQKFKNFVESCRAIGIEVPIIPGLKPISNKSQLVSLSKFFHIDLPDELVDAIEKCKNDDAVKQVGIEWAIQQSKDLLAFGSPCIHYYTMGKSVATREIIKQVF
ncbi:MAG: methylenetetrahydrofolate reductase [NAD(P)H] [Flavobacteriales bacterium]|jgi:methylenetetrahydrofolate reductase (NADPH)|nr:methylenetetrahydrofolate reductase [NAD(P)H] [Flavobacteriales bacterium]MBV6485937.1 5,10-methylenetetrahydrofolate reductase [Flavobacteriales bacterium]MBX2958919.1 methylenetetrahydrofolate reductase [NAD(P)H] [Flavobacteriales bacterium]MCL4855854.1 methylenetetrahydrofolate reductase [NAD(P)H] [Flavobacteriales bacterium]HRN41576.1 methylenetetrahydrofolate reductase [NAD(P)H] [Vicingus sp.]